MKRVIMIRHRLRRAAVSTSRAEGGTQAAAATLVLGAVFAVGLIAAARSALAAEIRSGRQIER